MSCNQSCLAKDQGQDLLPYPDINGPGVLISFYASIALSIATCVAIHGLAKDGFGRRAFLKLHRCADNDTENQVIAQATLKLRRFLLNLSDQQLVTGIGICLAMYIRICETQIWHFFAACHLALLAFAVHLLTLHTLRDQFSERLSEWPCRLRLLFMVVNLLLVSPSICHVILSTASDWSVPPGVFPAICLFSESFRAHTVIWGWVVLAIVAIFVALIIASVASYLLMDLEGGNFRLRRRMARTSGILVALGVMFVLGMSIHKAGSVRGSHPQLSNDWSFGQILPVAMLFLALLNAWAMEM